MYIVIKLENTDGQEEENNYVIQGIIIEGILVYILPIVKILVHNMRSQYILNV